MGTGGGGVLGWAAGERSTNCKAEVPRMTTASTERGNGGAAPDARTRLTGERPAVG